MIESIFRVFTIIVGRYFLGFIGRGTRIVYRFFRKLFTRSSQQKLEGSEFDEVIDVQGTKDIYVGALVLFILLLIAVMYQI